MKRLSRISIFFFLLLAIGCNSQTETPTSLPITETIEYTETPKPTSTPTTSFSPTPEQVTIEFPEWVKNPETQILLVPFGTRDERYMGMALFNAETGEKFNIPSTVKPRHYFWVPDGSGFGFLTKSKQEITLVSIQNGIISTIPVAKDSLDFVWQDDDDADPLQITSSVFSSPDLLFLPLGYELSPNKKYFEYQEQYDNTYTSIFDISQKQIVYISDPKDGYFDLMSEWSPNSQLLAISQAGEDPGNFYTFEYQPTFRLRVYDVNKKQLIASYKNVTFPKWSPDGTKFLYQEWKKWGEHYWYGEAPPCVYDTISGNTDCYNEVIAHHKKSNTIQTTISSLQWSPDQTMIGYISFNVDQSPYKEYGSFCTILTSAKQPNCILETLDHEGQKMIDYTWSPDSGFISFIFDTSCPYCDYRDYPQTGIANVQTGEYFSTGSYTSFYMGLWRPSPNP